MPGFIPNGYLSVQEAVDRFGRDEFASEWTGEEHNARPGLISHEEWLRIKDLPPARGGGAPGGDLRGMGPPPATPRPSDPSDPLYQEEYRARERYETARQRLHVLLERGELKAAIWDPFTGALHSASTSLWRRHDANRMIDKGQAPIPRNPNKGQLLVRQFTLGKELGRAMSQAKINEAVELLKEKTATETLTRPQQREVLRKAFPNYRLTERQIIQIFRQVPARTGRPKKSGK